MKIAVIGAGFTGLATSLKLAESGNEVIVFEKDKNPGGLAVGFKPARNDSQSDAGGEKNWEWSLEKHYHHWFANDSSVLTLADKINHEVILKRPKTSIYIKNKIYQLDSPMHVLKFPLLPIWDKLRMAIALGILKFNPLWKPLEKFPAHEILIKMMGKNSYERIWEPQLKNKFGKYYKEISLAWFWARIKKRTPSLAYPANGFLEFAQHLVKESKKKNVKFMFDTEVTEIKSNKKVSVKYKMVNGKLSMVNFDKVIVTLPSFFFVKIAKDLPQDYRNKLLSLKGLGAINLVLRLKKPFLKDGTYWLSICEKNAPIMAIVEHTSFMDKKHYGNEHLVYLGNYLPADHEYMKLNSEELLKIYHPFLEKINSNYQSSIIDIELFKAPFAQPIIPINYSKLIPTFKTPLENVFLANIQQVYPWDRGTNYAVELGEKIAEYVEKH